MNRTIQQTQSNIEHGDAIDLAKYLNFLVDNRWLIASIALAATLFGAVYALLATPAYEANILVQVEDSAGSAKNILGDLTGAFDIKTATTSEMEILRSRAVVSRAVDNAKLYIGVQPKYFPVVGAWIAGRNKKISDPGLFGYGGYVWGAELAGVSVFNVPEELEGQSFVLTADGNDNFHLSQNRQKIEFKGKVGETLKVEAGNGEIELRVDRLAAKPGAQFLLTRAARVDAIEYLQKALTISEKGKQSGVIGVALEGQDAKKTSSLLNEIGHEYIRQNVERRTEEAEKSLAFLNKQLPDIKQELERSEARYNELRNNRKTVDLGEEARTVLQQSVLAQTKMVELKQKKEELLIRFQEEHPAVMAVNQQMQELGRELASVDNKIKKLPAVEQDVLRLNRDVKVNTELYTSLLSTAQQLRLATASKVGHVRLLDTAITPNKPIKPKRLMLVSLAGLIGLVLGVAGAFVKKALYGRIDDPREVEQLLGLTVTATIPHSESQKRISAQVQGGTNRVLVLPHDAPSDIAIESLRRFRTSLQHAMLDSQNNIIMITGPTPGVGKSFVSANFAAVLASIGKKVLLVDGDLRTGHLHRYFGLQRKRGLSDALAGEMSSDQAIHKNVVENVDFISTGSLPTKPAELLAHEKFGRLLELYSTRYDFVLIDTAPVLAVSDALIVAAHAGAIFNIVRGGVSTVSEIDEAVKRLNQAGRTVTGIVFNDSKPRSARYGYGSAYGKYQYAVSKV